MLQKVLIIIVSVSIFGILLFSFVRQKLKRYVDYLVEEEKKKKKIKNYNFFSRIFNSFLSIFNTSIEVS